MKKKYSVTKKDREEWINFTQKLNNVFDKDVSSQKKNTETNKLRILDLHGSSLDKANKLVKEFIIKSFTDGYKRLLIITGKGLRSKVYKNPYFSEKMSVLKHSVPEFISGDEDLNNRVSKITMANPKDGGEGAFYIFLRKKKL